MDTHLFVGLAGYVGRPEEEGAVGIFRKSITEGTWQHVLDFRDAHVVYVHPNSANYIFAGTDDGIWRSTDKGLTFEKANLPRDGIGIWSFLTSEDDPDVMFAGGSPIEIFKSIDRGKNWTSLAVPILEERCSGPFSPRVMRMVQKPGEPDEIFAAMEIAGALKTVNGGKTWKDVSDDLVQLSSLPHLQSSIVQKETLAEGMLDAHAITICPSQPDEIFLALRMGVFKSSNGGSTWEDIKIGRFSPTTYGRDIKVSPSDPSTMYVALSVAAASHEGGIYRSTDCGKSWSRFDKVEVNGTIMSIALNASNSDQVFIGARYNGEIFGTLNGGETWQEMSLPGKVKDIYSLACG